MVYQACAISPNGYKYPCVYYSRHLAEMAPRKDSTSENTRKSESKGSGDSQAPPQGADKGTSQLRPRQPKESKQKPSPDDLQEEIAGITIGKQTSAKQGVGL